MTLNYRTKDLQRILVATPKDTDQLFLYLRDCFVDGGSFPPYMFYYDEESKDFIVDELVNPSPFSSREEVVETLIDFVDGRDLWLYRCYDEVDKEYYKAIPDPADDEPGELIYPFDSVEMTKEQVKDLLSKQDVDKVLRRDY